MTSLIYASRLNCSCQMTRGRKKKASSLELLTRNKKRFEKEELGNTQLYKNTMLRELTQNEKALEVESLNKLTEIHRRNGNRYSVTRTRQSSLAYLRRLRQSLDNVIRFLEVSGEVVEGGEEQYD